MSLSDRLARAAAERARAQEAGTTVEQIRRQQPIETSLLPPAPVPAPTIIIAGSTTLVAVDPDPHADPRSVCPTCGRTGELGLVDLPGRTSDWSCMACGTMWRLKLPPQPDS